MYVHFDSFFLVCLFLLSSLFFFFFFFNDTATTEIYTLSLHDALPISTGGPMTYLYRGRQYLVVPIGGRDYPAEWVARSEEHTSELQSQSNLVCRLLLEKKKKTEDRTVCVPSDATQ